MRDQSILMELAVKHISPARGAVMALRGRNNKCQNILKNARILMKALLKK